MGDNAQNDAERSRPVRRVRRLRPFRITTGNPMLVLPDDGSGESDGPGERPWTDEDDAVAE